MDMNVKMKILNDMIEECSNMEGKAMLMHLIKESANAQKKGIFFSDEETEYIINSLKEKMSPEDIKKINIIRKFVKKQK